jgi:hypothetical protein
MDGYDGLSSVVIIAEVQLLMMYQCGAVVLTLPSKKENEQAKEMGKDISIVE